MPRFSSNRWWTSILTTALLVVCLSMAAKSGADPLRYGDWSTVGIDQTGPGGLPPPTGVGDPDQPVNTRLKYMQRGSIGGGGSVQVTRTAGDRRFTSDVWMVRLLVMQRLLRSMLYRF